MSICISDLLKQSSARHDHLCPRQVLGVRIGLAGLAALGLESPINKSMALVILETDGCFADGIEVATGATIGHRTLRVNDIGKLAATFADVKTGRAIRVSPAPKIREHALCYAPDEQRKYFAQLKGYEIMPEAELLRIQDVELHPTLKELTSDPLARTQCDYCGEDIINERQVIVNGATLCRTCANDGYYLAQSVAEENCIVVKPRF